MSDNAAIVIIIAIVAVAWIADNFFSYKRDKDEE